MRFSHFFIDRPIFATVVSILIVLVGAIAYIGLPVAQYPEVAPPTIQVNPEGKQPFFDGLCTLPVRAEGAEPKQEAFKASIVSHQHPDHDTTDWTPAHE